MSTSHSDGPPSTSYSDRSPSTSHPNKSPSTPPRDPAQLSAHSLSLQSTKYNKGSSSYKEFLGIVKCVCKSLRLAIRCRFHPYRKDAIECGVTVDMTEPQRCNPVDMVQFLLAFCCTSDSSDVLCDAQVTNERFRNCWSEVVSVVDFGRLEKRLDQ